ncbi:basic proline-rich protein-like [Ammospiza nelsoni]|uniref:basic proline-rich protein-like n=1 Tax=Ammospiza caudacuta TaxID=2857398 RepID=UPI002739F794|nr:basic proline-rich protein-like [Ammospiza caudacuta]XP_059323662.1 basic proline-rich protein-like [Ammospiza nelsoni]
MGALSPFASFAIAEVSCAKTHTALSPSGCLAQAGHGPAELKAAAGRRASAEQCAARSGALWVGEAACAGPGAGGRAGPAVGGTRKAERKSEAGGDRGSRPSSRRALQRELHSEPDPAAAAPPSLPTSPRPQSDVPAERAVRRRPPRDALSGERRRHGGKRSVPPFQLSPLPLPAPGRSSGRFPSPFMPGRRPPAALPSAPASPPPPFPGSPR